MNKNTRNSRFQRGSGCYVCHICHRLTRDTQGESGAELCAQCFDICSNDNAVNDNCLTGAEAQVYIDKSNTLLAEIVKRGGSAERVKKSCSYIWPAA